jgi:hypothetical protein
VGCRHSLAATVLGLLPSAWDLGRRPSPTRFCYALFNGALTFFLLSFQVRPPSVRGQTERRHAPVLMLLRQVHEKSILLATVPAALLLPRHPDIAAWFITTATFRWRDILARTRCAPCGQR